VVFSSESQFWWGEKFFNERRFLGNMRMQSRNPVRDLEVAVAEGIRQRGFHLLFEADVLEIAGGGAGNEQWRTEQIERFANRRQWIAVVGFGARSALIRRQAAVARVREIWGRERSEVRWIEG
jgi:hypothetical protein